MPTFESVARFDREFRRMPRELQLAFLAMLPTFITALRANPPTFPPALRVKRVQGKQDAHDDGPRRDRAPARPRVRASEVLEAVSNGLRSV